MKLFGLIAAGIEWEEVRLMRGIEGSVDYGNHYSDYSYRTFESCILFSIRRLSI